MSLSGGTEFLRGSQPEASPREIRIVAWGVILSPTAGWEPRHSEIWKAAGSQPFEPTRTHVVVNFYSVVKADLWSRRNSKYGGSMKVGILAGGVGTRLAEETEITSV